MCKGSCIEMVSWGAIRHAFSCLGGYENMARIRVWIPAGAVFDHVMYAEQWRGVAPCSLSHWGCTCYDHVWGGPAPEAILCGSSAPCLS